MGWILTGFKHVQDRYLHSDKAEYNPGYPGLIRLLIIDCSEMIFTFL